MRLSIASQVVGHNVGIPANGGRSAFRGMDAPILMVAFARREGGGQGQKQRGGPIRRQRERRRKKA